MGRSLWLGRTGYRQNPRGHSRFPLVTQESCVSVAAWFPLAKVKWAGLGGRQVKLLLLLLASSIEAQGIGAAGKVCLVLGEVLQKWGISRSGTGSVSSPLAVFPSKMTSGNLKLWLLPAILAGIRKDVSWASPGSLHATSPTWQMGLISSLMFLCRDPQWDLSVAAAFTTELLHGMKNILLDSCIPVSKSFPYAVAITVTSVREEEEAEAKVAKEVGLFV